MKKLYLWLVGLCMTIGLQAQVEKTVELTSGNLAVLLTDEEKNTITSLTLIGTVDARDFITTSLMPLLTKLDLSQTQVTAIHTLFAERVAISKADTIGSYGYNPRESSSLFSSRLTSLKLPSTLKAIDINGLKNCSGLTALEIPSTVTFIGLYAFWGCSGLTSLSIPPSVTYIETEAFYGCSGLEELILSASIDGIKRYTFAFCSSLTTLTIPSQIVYIEEGGFMDCTALTTVILPETFQGLDYFAFLRCPNITSIYSYNPIPPAVAAGAFDVEIHDGSVYVPYGSGPLYAEAEGWKDFIHIIEMIPFTLSATEFNVEAVPAVQSLEITTDGEWYTTCDKNWLTVSPASGESTKTVTFTCLENTTFEPRTATVTFNDKNDYSQIVTITQKARINYLPVADAGDDQTVEEGALVQLDGSASEDADLDTLIFLWTSPEGITLSSVSDARPTFTAPKVEKDTTFTFKLVVSDGKEYSASDKVHITVQNKILELGVSAEAVVFERGESSAKVLISGNAEWIVRSDHDWLSVTPGSGVGEKQITLLATANETVTERMAIVTVSAPEVEAKTITVTQHGIATGTQAVTSKFPFTCYPNPFTHEMAIEIANPQLEEVSVDIYSMNGQKIRTLARALKGQKISLHWNGSNDQGKMVPDGIYLLKMNKEIRKVIKRQE